MTTVSKTKPKATEARLESAGGGVFRPSGLGPCTVKVTREDSITPIDLRQQSLHETRRRCVGGQPIVDPLAVSQPFDESCLAEDAQVPADPRLTLTQRLRQIGNAQVPLLTQRKQPQPARLSGRA